MKKKAQQSIVLLGSTGSIGASTLEVIRRFKERFRVVGIGAGSNIAALNEQIKQLKPRYVAAYNDDAARALRAAHAGHKVFSGLDGLCELVSLDEVDTVVIAITGSIALVPLICAIQAGKKIALANKESLVVGGHIVKEELRKNKKACIVPIDSEQNAIFQCLQGHDDKLVRALYLTASGGPLLDYTRKQLRGVSPGIALSHPRWKMGKKISIDSATLMNKGLEVIEARWLFDMPLDKIKVVIHRQAIIHSLVEFIDGSLLGQLSVTDMQLPIQYALSFPERWPNNGALRLDLEKLQSLSFSKPDVKKFPCLALAYCAASKGPLLPCVLNAANEEAVRAFLERRISFMKIPLIIEKLLKKHEHNRLSGDLQEVLALEAEVRSQAGELIKHYGNKS